MRLILVVVIFGVVAVMALRGRRANFVVMTALTLAASTLGVFEAQWIYREHTYTAIAKELTGRDNIRVRCQRTLANLVDISGNLGYVPFPPDGTLPTDAFLRKDTCQHLSGYLNNTAAPTPDQIRAVHVLTHEAMHLRGTLDEAAAECAAIQRNFDTAVALGSTKHHAELLAETYYRDLHPLTGSRYQSPECRPGGVMDERLPQPPW